MAVDPVAVSRGFAFEDGEQVMAIEFQVAGRGCVGDGGQGGEDVGEIGDGGGGGTGFDVWAADDAGGSRALFCDGAFSCAAGSIVTDEDEVGVFVEVIGFEGAHEFAHEVVEVFEVGLEVCGPFFGGVERVWGFEVW